MYLCNYPKGCVQIANRPSIYVLDTPGVLVPSIPDLETGLKLALTGMVIVVLLSLNFFFYHMFYFLDKRYKHKDSIVMPIYNVRWISPAPLILP